MKIPITREELEKLRKEELAKKIDRYLKKNRERQKRYRKNQKEQK